jgi:hypothetical protein
MAVVEVPALKYGHPTQGLSEEENVPSLGNKKSSVERSPLVG